MYLVLTSLFFSLFITISLVPLCGRLAYRLQALDMPSARKVHSHPMPRFGGLAMTLGMLITVCLWLPKESFVKAFLISCIIIAIFGLMDDVVGMGYKTKFMGQVIAALVIMIMGKVRIVTLGTIIPSSLCLSDWFSYLLTLVVIVGVTNAINLSDGLDGLAGGICLLSFCCIAYLAYRERVFTIVLLAASIIGVIFGFLRFNTYPASIFMGDTGSQLLGFSGITLALKLTQESPNLSPVLPLIFFGFPVLDTLTVMAQRISEGRSPFSADKNHLHHKLIKLGFFHTEAVVIIYVFQFVLVISAIYFKNSPDWGLLAGYLLLCALSLVFFHYAEKTGYRVKRYDLIDNVFKGKLRVLRERGILIRICFKAVEWGTPMLVLFSVFLPRQIPRDFSVLSMPFLIFLIFSIFLKPSVFSASIRLPVYFLLPYVLYLGEINTAGWIPHYWLKFYNLGFALLAFFVILTLKFTRRKKGFKISPMDFLILFIVLAVSALPDKGFRNYHLGMLASKIIILFFTYEVLMGELRGEFKKLGFMTLLATLCIALRGFLQL